MNVVPSERAFDLGLESCSKWEGRVAVSEISGDEGGEGSESDMMEMKMENEKSGRNLEAKKI